MFMIYVPTKFYMLIVSTSMVVCVKMEIREHFRMSDMLFNFLQNIILKMFHIFQSSVTIN